MREELVQKSKEISYALRHRPEKYGLKIDGNGFTETNRLINSINSKHIGERSVSPLTLEDIEEIIATADKTRFELSSDKTRIRALYGHSFDSKVKHHEAVPTSSLWHGTTKLAMGSIEKDGLKPMKRQFVHLSKDIGTAYSVGRRRAAYPVILEIDAVRMAKDGFKFYRDSNDGVWLCDSVPVKYISNINSISDKVIEKLL